MVVAALIQFGLFRIFLNEFICLWIAQLLGFLEIDKSFFLFAFHALGKTEEELAVAIVGFQGLNFIGCFCCLVIKTNTQFQ